MDACTAANGFACFDRTAASQPIEPKPASFNANSATTKAKSTIAMTEKPSPADAGDKAVHLDAKKATNAIWSLLVMDDSNTHGTGTLDCFKLTVSATNPR